MEPDLSYFVLVFTPLWILFFVIGICLVLAPLFIWKWTKATARAVEENNRLLRILIQRIEHPE